MKPPKEIIRTVAPFKLDPELIEETKRAAKKLGFKFNYQYVEAVLKKANKKAK